MSGTHEHLEHAEHAGHQGADPLTRKAAMTMAIIAAILAAISLIGHRKHNEALQNQGDMNRFYTEAAANEVKSSNQFAWYQAKRARVDNGINSSTLAKILAPIPVPLEEKTITPNKSEFTPAHKKYLEEFNKQEALRTKQIKKWEDYKAKNAIKEHDIALDSEGFPARTSSGEEDDSYGALILRGKKFKEIAEHKLHEAEKKDKEFHHVHHQTDWLDYGHLLVELGLVLCTICVLTKKKEYLNAGMLAALIGIGLALYGLFLVH